MSTTGSTAALTATRHRTVDVDGVEIFYREAGDPANPTLLLLHGLPTSSRMFRNLIPALADRFHLVAPDYPGFGHSAFPPSGEFEYSFANLTRVVERFVDVIGLQRFSVYIQDYGAPIGLSIASTQPDPRPAHPGHARLRPRGQPAGPARSLLRLPAQPRQVPRLPAVLPRPPAADAARLGRTRRDLRPPRRPGLPARPPGRRAAPARHGAHRPRGGRCVHRRADRRVPRQAHCLTHPPPP